MRSDWIPGREGEFADLCGKWVSVLETEATISELGWKPDMCIATANTIKEYLLARSEYLFADTSENILVRNKTRKAAEKSMRLFANMWVRYNTYVDESIRMKMGIRVTDTVPTVQPRPTLMPETLVENNTNHYQHRIKAMNSENGKASKPDGVHGVRFSWQVGGEKPKTGNELPRGQFSRRAVTTVIHTEAEKGKPAFYATCYENRRGESGPWSPIVEAYIG